MTGNAKLAVGVGVVAALALGGGAFLLQKKQKPQPAPTAKLKTEPLQQSIHYFPIWEVRYRDKVLGEVRGRAFVDWDAKRARVELIDPTTGSLKKIYADSIELNGTETTLSTRVTFTFHGKSPEATPTKPPSTAGLKQISAKITDKASVTPAEPAFQAEVKEKARADLDLVRVTLAAGPLGMLRGSWSYKADPLTERERQREGSAAQDRSGGGRQGYYRLLDKEELEGPYEGFLGEESEVEEWTPILPSIAVVKVVENQLAYRGNWALYMYPWKPGLLPPEYEQRSTQRTLFVVGRNFPVDGGKVMCGVGRSPSLSGQIDGSTLQYAVEAVSTDPNIDAKHKEVMEKAWTTVLEGLSDEQKSLARSQLQAALIRADLSEGVSAGPKVFSWCGDKGSWFLQFGDNTAEARFIRSVAHKTDEPGSKEEWEYTDSVFLPEQLQVEVVTRARVPVEEIPVHIGRMGNDPKKWVTLTAHRVGGGTYRTDLFTLVDAGRPGAAKGITIPASNGDKLQATVHLDDVPFIAPPITEADVFLTPGRAPGSPLWKQTLADAQNAHAPEQNYHGIPVTTGQHAAMLLLQRSFVAMLKEEQKRINAIQTREEVLGFREWLKPFLAANEHRFIDPPQSPVGWEKYPAWLKTIDDINNVIATTTSSFSKIAGGLFDYVWNGKPMSSVHAFGQDTYWGEIEVTGPSGGTRKFWETYQSDETLDPYPRGSHIPPERLAKWRYDATKEVLDQYKKELNDAIENADSIQPTELKRLIHLTGLDFSATVIRVMPRLMKLEESGNTVQWVPDPVARTAVASASALNEAALANESYLDIRDKFIMTIVVGLVSAPAAIWDSASVAAYSWAANAGLTALQSGETIAEQFAVRKELDLLFGASGVIGTTQLDDTMLRKSEWSSVVLSLVPDLLQNAPGAIEHLPFLSDRANTKVQSMSQAVRRELAVVATSDAVIRLKQASLKIVAKLPKPNLESLIDLFGRSGTRLERAGALTREEAQAIVQAQRLADEVGEAKTGAHLNDEHGTAKTGTLVKTENPEPGAERFAPDPGPIQPWQQPGALAKTEPWSPPQHAGNGPAAAELPKTEPWSPPNPEPCVAPLPAADPPRPQPIVNAPPKAKSWTKVTLADKTEIEFETSAITEGASSAVSEIHDVRAIREIDKKFLEGDGAVLKILKDSKEFGTPEQQIARMQDAYKTLEEAKKKNPNIHFLEVLDWKPDAKPPYLIQRKAGKGTVLLRATQFKNPNIRGLLVDYKVISKTFTPDMQEAVVRLYRDLAKENIVSPDLSLPNLYFEKTESGYVAGILDIDHLVKVSATKPPGHKTWDWLRLILANQDYAFASVGTDKRIVSNAQQFMEKAFELQYGGLLQNGWIEFDRSTKTFTPILIDPQIIKKYFPNFRIDLSDAVPKRSSLLMPVLPWFRELGTQAERMWAAIFHPVAAPA